MLASAMNLFLERLSKAVPNVHLRRFLILLCTLFVVEIATGFISHIASDDPTPLSIARRQQADQGGDVPTSQDQPDPVPFPAHASARYLADLQREDLVAELVVQSPPDSDTYSVLRIENLGSREAVAQVYVEPGRQIRMMLPAAKYRVKFARGKTWYGEQLLFGSETRAYMTSVIDLGKRRDGAAPSARVALQGFIDGTTRGGRGIKKEQFQ